MESTVTFPKVWYVRREIKWSDLKFPKWDDSGPLTVSNSQIVFNGRLVDREIPISDVKSFAYARQDGDFVHNWVRVEDADGKVAYFADGGFLGFAGLFGGTKRMFEAMLPFIGERKVDHGTKELGRWHYLIPFLPLIPFCFLGVYLVYALLRYIGILSNMNP